MYKLCQLSLYKAGKHLKFLFKFLKTKKYLYFTSAAVVPELQCTEATPV